MLLVECHRKKRLATPWCLLPAYKCVTARTSSLMSLLEQRHTYRRRMYFTTFLKFYPEKTMIANRGIGNVVLEGVAGRQGSTSRMYNSGCQLHLFMRLYLCCCTCVWRRWGCNNTLHFHSRHVVATTAVRRSFNCESVTSQWVLDTKRI